MGKLGISSTGPVIAMRPRTARRGGNSFFSRLLWSVLKLNRRVEVVASTTDPTKSKRNQGVENWLCSASPYDPFNLQL
jgi:hypothetical protein